VYLDIASRMTPEEIKKRLPSMYHQFIELAEVDITKDMMEVGPTCHYVMGGIEVDPDSGAGATPGLFAAGECSGGMHGSNRLGGNSLSDLLVFGRRAGLGASDYVRALAHRPTVSDAALEEAAGLALAPFEPKANPENPYTLHAELQQSMNDLAGIIRKEGELQEALAKIDELKARYANVAVEGGRVFNPGWHLAIDLRNMLLVCRVAPGDAVVPEVTVTPEQQPVMRPDLLATFELSELEKYYTDDQLVEHPDRKG
jgi:succinate dehydrogenase / fumarate reductase flavoprotein subunit